MFTKQSVQAALDLNAKKMLPIHWGVFSLGRNSWYQSIDTAIAEASSHNLAIDVPKMGEKYQASFTNDDWWKAPELRRIEE